MKNISRTFSADGIIFDDLIIGSSIFCYYGSNNSFTTDIYNQTAIFKKKGDTSFEYLYIHKGKMCNTGAKSCVISYRHINNAIRQTFSDLNQEIHLNKLLNSQVQLDSEIAEVLNEKMWDLL